MSQGAHTRVTIGRAVQTRQMAPRSMNEAFGPYARLDVERRKLGARNNVHAVALAVRAGLI